jgi:hypothetical protein
MSRTKTEYLQCKFSQVTSESDVEVRLDTQLLPKKDKFKYLGSFIQRDGEIDDDVTHRIGMGWLKWRMASSVLCDKNISCRLKGNFYKIVVRPAILYGTEFWAIKKSHVRRVEVAEMRMLRWMCGHTRRDKISNDVIRSKLGVVSIAEKMREARLRWFGHVRRRPVDAPVRRCENLNILGFKRNRGRPKKTWGEVIRNDMSLIHVTEDLTLDRKEWRARIRVVD